jgi:hypothetical protein
MTRFEVRTLLLLCVTPLLSIPGAARAAESYDNCAGFITSVPAVISTQGTWCLKQDLATAMASGNAITIATNNVTIDCNNFKLGGLAAGVGTQAIGINAFDRQNATVRHCNIRGFYNGILIESDTTGGHLVEDNRFDGNTYSAIHVTGDGSTVQRNRVFDTGGTTVFDDARAIVTFYNVDVIDNTIAGVTARSGAGSYAIGIQTTSNGTGSVNGNRLSGLLGDAGGGSYAIYNFSDSRMAVHDNDLLGSADPGSVGIVCMTGKASARNNVINGFSSPWTACTDSGGNAVIP